MYLYIGQSIPDKASSIISQLPNDVHEYVAILRRQCQHNPIVITDWPPRIGQCYFGRLGLVEKQGFDDETEKETSWHMLRGEVDKIPNLSGLKEIPIEEVLETKDSQSLRVVIDGPPGIGKTTLCRKLLNMWSNGEIKCQQYDLVLYCPLRNKKIATANNLAELLKAVYESPKVPEVDAWLTDREGKGLLIIFDGWDELNEQSRESSLAASLFRRDLLNYCAVIITSRSYASSSLLEMDTHSKHVQVIGFSEEEVNTVIIKTLVAQELLDEMKQLYMHCSDDESFSTIESKDLQLAVQLINEVKIRTDVQSLCYIPLVCSMVIFVYRKEKKLPNTLTQLYETFILLTIKRHIKKRHSNIDHKRIQSLNNLPSLLEQPFQEMCRLAYTSLKNETNKMTFSCDQLKDYSLNEAAKEDYFGLMTSFEDYEEWYQFIHLSIQEFLAAWWIAKHEEKTEEVFKDHFDSDHFRMCLRFVAGLTHLKHENYQQHFNKQLDLQCKTKSLFGFHALHDSCFTSNKSTRPLVSNSNPGHGLKSVHFDKFSIFLLQLLYESQNTTLCRVLAQSIKDSSLCLHNVPLSSFDMMCLSFFIDNSNITWNHLDLQLFFDITGQKISIFFDGLTNKTLQTTTSCKKCKITILPEPTKKETIVNLLQPSHLLHNIEEFNFICLGHNIPFCTFSLPKIKVLHMNILLIRADYTSDCSKLEKYIESNSTLQELDIVLVIISYDKANLMMEYIICVIKGLKRNKSITSFSLSLEVLPFSQLERALPLPDGVIEDLLKYNKTLKALSLLLPSSYCSPPIPNIEEVNTPLIALRINSKTVASLLPHINGLQHLKLNEPLPLKLIPYSLPPSLQTLELELEVKSATELFNILQSNTTLKGLKVSTGVNIGISPMDMLMKDKTFIIDKSFGISLRDMLTHNQTLQYLHIAITDTSYMPFLITGLKNNTSLQHLTIPVMLHTDDGDEFRTFCNVISQKSNLTELGLTFIMYPLEKYEELMEQLMKTLFHEQVLPAVTSMLQSHTTMRILDMYFDGIRNTDAFERTIQISHHMCTDQFRNFHKTIFHHSSLEYVSIDNEVILAKMFKEQEKASLQQEALH